MLVEQVIEGRPFSLFFPGVVSKSERMGLDGIGASLLGTGVMEAGGFVNADFESVETGVVLDGVEAVGAGLGELVDFFWKKPRMDF